MEQPLRDNPIHSSQHGFSSGKSTETAISTVADRIERFVLKRKACLGVFLDIKGAFDSILPEHIHASLIKFGADRKMADWYHSYLVHRNLYFENSGVEISCTINIGFPQGGVASAKFWLIAFDEAVHIINSCSIDGTAFADDCAALYGSLDTCCEY